MSTDFISRVLGGGGGGGGWEELDFISRVWVTASHRQFL